MSRISAWGLLLFCLMAASASSQPPRDPVQIGNRLELFADDALIERMQGLTLKLHEPQPREVALQFDKPWEGPTSTYVTVFKDGEQYRLYYRGSGTEANQEVACYAESKDGIAWHKPKLGIYPWNGNRQTNIVWQGKGAHNFAPFLDQRPGVHPEARYKAPAARLFPASKRRNVLRSMATRLSGWCGGERRQT